METNQRKTSGRPSATATPVDWDAVAIAFCTTHQSAREIGAAHGISHTAVQKHAKAKGWTRPEKKPGLIPVRKRSVPEVPAAPDLPVDEDACDARGGAELTTRQQRFVDEYLVDLNGTQAAIRAGYSAKTAAEQSYDLLRRPHIAAAVATGQAALQDRTQVTAARVIQEIAMIAFADPRELVETKVGCCRHCWGKDFKRQRTQYQRDADLEAWRKKAKPDELFDEEGGTGFNPHLPPNPDCIECCGDGLSRDVIKDTRYLSPAAAALYAGVRRTKEGFQVLTQDKGAALDRLARHLGIFEKDNGQRNDPLALRTMSDTERAVRLSTVLQGNPALLAMFAQLTAGDTQQ